MLIRTQFSDFFLTTMKPALELVIGDNYRRWPKQWPHIFRQETTRNSIWQSTTVAGTGLATQINEGQPVLYDQPVQGFDKTFTPVRYGLGIQISQDVQDSDTKLKASARQGRWLSNSIAETQEVQMASVFNNGFSGGPTGPDGVVLFSASHPLVKAGGVQSNLLSAAADLDNTSLELALIDYETMVTPEGHKMNLGLPSVVVAPANRFVIAEILNSADRSDTPNRATNAFKYSNGGLPRDIVWNYLTDTDAWFLVAPPEDAQLIVVWNRKPYTRYGFDFDTETGKVAMRYSLDVGWSDFYGTYGTPGA